jgi:hypothetical protein
MGPKLLFGLGIVLAHGAMAAGWLVSAAPEIQSTRVSTCTQLPPAQPLDFTPQRELLAYAVTPEAFQVLRP